ncbi:hypothetical protein Tco_0307309 [Tanacetum coccineum]
MENLYPKHGLCEINFIASGKLRNKNADKSWEIIENLTLYDHEGWDDIKEFIKPVKVITSPHGIPKTPDMRLLDLEDQINFLLKGSRLVPLSSSTHNSQAYVKAVHPNSHPQNQNEPPKLNNFAFREHIVNEPDEGHEEEGNLGYTNYIPHPQSDPFSSIATKQVRKLNSMLELLGLVPRSPNAKFVCSKEDDGEVVFIKIIRDDNEPQSEGPNEIKGATTEGPPVEYLDTFLTRDELTYHRLYLMRRSLEVLRKFH